MKRSVFFFFLLLIVFGAKAQHELIYKGSRFKYVLSLDSVLSGDSVNYNCVVRSIKIFRIRDEKAIQVIAPGDNYPDCGLPPDQLFIIEDMNFDGFEDIRLVQFIPASPNVPYYFWVYDVRRERFVQNKGLEEITSPVFDHKRKLITSFWRSGCCKHGSSRYKYINGHPTLIEESEVALDPNDDSKQVMTVKTLRNGKWEVTKTKS